MRPDEVPAKSASIYEGATKAAYALGADGRYIIVPNGGTEAEVSVTEDAVAWFEKMAEQARLRARAGETSPLEYHMFRCRMDVPNLSQATGFWQWTIRRHLRPENFARLSDKKLACYAAALGENDPARLRTLPA